MVGGVLVGVCAFILLLSVRCRLRVLVGAWLIGLNEMLILFSFFTSDWSSTKSCAENASGGIA